MPRRRTHDLDRLLDVTETLAAAGPVTIRAVAAASGVSNGAIYHAFGSLPVLLARTWLRAATAFLDLQTSLVAVADPVEAVVAAASAPALFADARPAAARLLLEVRREDLLGPGLPAATAEALRALDTRLLALLKSLADALWGRADSATVEIVTLCVVDLPGAFFHRALAAPSGLPVTAGNRLRLEAAVRAVLSVDPTGKAGHAHARP